MPRYPTQSTCVAAGNPADPCSTNSKLPARGLCQKHYRRMRRHGTLTPPERIDNLTRYTVDVDGCWIWDGSTFPNGYGQLSRKIHGTTLAHRAYWIEHRGPLPMKPLNGIADLELDHLCRKRLCVQPWTCLEPVTREENMLRGARGFNLTGLCRRGLHTMDEPDAMIIRIDPNGKVIRECRDCRLACRRVWWARNKSSSSTESVSTHDRLITSQSGIPSLHQ